MKKKILILFGVFMLFSSLAMAEETLTLTTYYPSPFGAYDRLRLVPRDPLPTPCDLGTIFFRNTDNMPVVCQKNLDGKTFWGPFGVWVQDIVTTFLTADDSLGASDNPKKLDGSLFISQDLMVDRNAMINGNLNVTGAVSMKSLSFADLTAQNITANQSLTVNGPATINGLVSATGFAQASSQEYKQDIVALRAEDAFNALEGLNPVTYTFKSNSKKHHVGFIAEDVPDLVASQDRKSLSAMDIVAVLTRVVQEQQRVAQEQQKEIDELKARLK